MKSLTHKQAMKLIDLHLDGMLKASQQTLLAEHLRVCDSCRLYSSQMELLPIQLNHEFKSRWDTNPGPSQHLPETVAINARRIPMANRLSSNLRLLAATVVLIVLTFAINVVVSRLQSISPAAAEFLNGSLQNDSELIAFTSTQNGNSDIYTIHDDGSGLTNITNNPAEDTDPVWSPDGAQIAFVSNRDGNENIYVMNVDGSNVTRLTDAAAQDTNPLWSPDGIKIAYASGDFSKNNTNIYVMESNGQNQRRLTSYVPNTTVWPQAWSPDSRFILFDVYRQVVQVGIDDGLVTPITPQTDLDIPFEYVLSTDGSTLTYLTAVCDRSERGSNEFCNVLKTINRDGSNEQSKAVLQIPTICGVGVNLTWMGSATRWSPDRTKLLISFTCEDENNGRLYIANADGSGFKPLANYPVFGNLPDHEVGIFEWSPDSQSIIFAAPRDNAGQDALYLLNIHDVLTNRDLHPTRLNVSLSGISSIAWQPIAKNKVIEEKPTSTPDKFSLTNTPQETLQAFRFGAPVENHEQALIVAQSGLSRQFDYTEPLKVIAVKQQSYGEYSKETGQPLNISADTQIWLVVYYNEEWQSTFTVPSIAINDQGVYATVPPEARTPASPFRGCVSVIINADDGSLVEVGGPLQNGIIPECNK